MESEPPPVEDTKVIPVVLIIGALAEIGDWDGQIQALKDQGYLHGTIDVPEVHVPDEE